MTEKQTTDCPVTTSSPTTLPVDLKAGKHEQYSHLESATKYINLTNIYTAAEEIN